MREVPPVFGIALAQHLRDTNVPKPTAMGTRLRYSRGGSCAMHLGLTAAGIPETDPMDMASHHVANIGTLGHEHWQKILPIVFPDYTWEFEVATQIEGADLSGSCDALGITPDGHKIVFELKHMGGAAFRIASGLPDKGDRIKDGKGPRDSAVVQGCLNAFALDADEVRWPLLSYEAVSIGRAERMGISDAQRFATEWSMDRDEIARVAEAEIERCKDILGWVDEAGVLPDRVVPSWDMGAGVLDPNGTFVEDPNDSYYWGCSGYCNHASLCKQLPAGDAPEIPVALAVSVATQNGWMAKTEEAA